MPMVSPGAMPPATSSSTKPGVASASPLSMARARRAAGSAGAVCAAGGAVVLAAVDAEPDVLEDRRLVRSEAPGQALDADERCDVAKLPHPLGLFIRDEVAIREDLEVAVGVWFE